MTLSSEKSANASVPRRVGLRGRSLFLLTMTGIFLVQIAWAIVVPAFRGYDEHDHAYRAASVAEGHWLPDYRTPADGRGDLIPVPEDIVVAANPVCEFLEYTLPDNCRGVSDLGGGQVLSASAAARYNPVFYWVVGTAARPFEGATALYVMRIVAALMCAALIAAAVTLTLRWSATVWPAVALVAVATPIVTYSSMVAAPNGVELTSALLLWSSLLGLATRPEPRLERQLLLAGGIGAGCLATVRTMGPLWVLLILAVGLWLIRPQAVRGIHRRHRTVFLSVGATTVMTTVGGVIWTLVASPNNPASERSGPWPGSPWPHIAEGVPVWILQSIGAFPLRGQPAPLVVYAVFLILWLPLIAAGLRLTTRRGPMVFVGVLSLLIPVALTLVSHRELGPAWQGRYGYPLSMGVLLLAGLALDRAGWLDRLAQSVVPAVAVAAGMSCVVAQLNVRTIVLADDVTPSWQTGPAWAVAVLTLSGFALLAFALRAPIAPASRQPG